MVSFFRRILGKRGGGREGEEGENPEVIDRMLEEKYHMPFEDFYYLVEGMEAHRLVEAGYDWDEILGDFGKWVRAAQKLGKLKKADRMWKRVFP